MAVEFFEMDAGHAEISVAGNILSIEGQMPSVSRAQQHLFQAAKHNANFPMAKKIRASMTMQQMHDFAVGSEKGKPEHVKKAKKRAR